VFADRPRSTDKPPPVLMDRAKAAWNENSLPNTFGPMTRSDSLMARVATRVLSQIRAPPCATAAEPFRREHRPDSLPANSLQKKRDAAFVRRAEMRKAARLSFACEMAGSGVVRPYESSLIARQGTGTSAFHIGVCRARLHPFIG